VTVREPRVRAPARIARLERAVVTHRDARPRAQLQHDQVVGHGAGGHGRDGRAVVHRGAAIHPGGGRVLGHARRTDRRARGGGQDERGGMAESKEMHDGSCTRAAAPVSGRLRFSQPYLPGASRPLESGGFTTIVRESTDARRLRRVERTDSILDFHPIIRMVG
jgi:hypothetical protein